MSSSGVHSACKRLGIPLRSQKEGAAQGRTPIPDTLFASPLNANESWLPGLLLTDGCVHKNIVKLSITDEDAVHLAFQVIGFGNIVKGPPHGLKTYSGLKIEGKLPVWTYTACSIELVERLENWGLVPRKTKTLAFPDPAAMSLPDFIRGLWDSYGCWYIQSKRTGALGSHFGSASEQFIRALHLLIARITGSAATVRANKRGDFWQLQYAGAGAVALARWLYTSPNPMRLARKLAIVKSFL